MDFKVVLKVFVCGAHVGRDMTFNTQAQVPEVVEEIKAAHPDQIDPSAKYCLHIPDPKLHADSQWLEGAVPLSVASTLKTGDRVELRRVPLKLDVYFAVENKNLVRSLRRSKEMVYLEPTTEIVLSIGRLKRTLGDMLPPDEYCFALVNRDASSAGADQRFTANWINGNSTPEFYGIGSDAELLLWPLRLFMRKTAEDLKNPTCAGQLRITKKDNPGKAERRFAVIKFNLFFAFSAPRGKTPDILANLEHYFVTNVTKEGKKRWKFKLDKVMESFTPTPAAYWLVFDDETTARQWNAALATECANRQGGTKLPPPRIVIPDKVPKNLFPKDPVALPEPGHDPPRLDLADVEMPDTSAKFVAQRALGGGGSGGGDAPNVLSPMRASGNYSLGTPSPGGSADTLPPLASSMGAPPPPGAGVPLASSMGAPPPPGASVPPLASSMGAPPPPAASSVGAPPPPAQPPAASAVGAPPPPAASAVGAPPPPAASAVGAPPPPAASAVGAPPPPAASAVGAPPPPAAMPVNLPPPTNLPPPPGAMGAPPPAATAPAVVAQMRALYDYEAPDAENDQGERAIDFNKGQLLDVFEKRDDGWFKGRNPETGKVGLLPGNFLK